LALFPIIVIFIFFIRKKEIKLEWHNLDEAPSYKEIRKLAYPMFLFSSTLLLGNWITTLMVGALGSTADAGIYRVLDRVSSLNVLVLTAVNAVVAPKIAGAFAERNIELLKKHVQAATKFTFWASLPIQIIVILFHSQVLGIFGKEFIAGSTALIITMLGQIVNSLAGPVGQILNMTDNQIFLRNASMIGLVITTLSSWVLIPIYGITGAAIASLINSLFINLICLIKIKTKFSFNTLYNPFKIK
jgi:O-antigen/teichoic acid export membrane protein